VPCLVTQGFAAGFVPAYEASTQRREARRSAEFDAMLSKVDDLQEARNEARQEVNRRREDAKNLTESLGVGDTGAMFRALELYDDDIEKVIENVNNGTLQFDQQPTNTPQEAQMPEALTQDNIIAASEGPTREASAALDAAEDAGVPESAPEQTPSTSTDEQMKDSGLVNQENITPEEDRNAVGTLLGAYDTADSRMQDYLERTGQDAESFSSDVSSLRPESDYRLNVSGTDMSLEALDDADTTEMKKWFARNKDSLSESENATYNAMYEVQEASENGEQLNTDPTWLAKQDSATLRRLARMAPDGSNAKRTYLNAAQSADLEVILSPDFLTGIDSDSPQADIQLKIATVEDSSLSNAAKRERIDRLRELEQRILRGGDYDQQRYMYTVMEDGTLSSDYIPVDYNGNVYRTANGEIIDPKSQTNRQFVDPSSADDFRKTYNRAIKDVASAATETTAIIDNLLKLRQSIIDAPEATNRFNRFFSGVNKIANEGFAAFEFLEPGREYTHTQAIDALENFEGMGEDVAEQARYQISLIFGQLAANGSTGVGVSDTEFANTAATIPITGNPTSIIGTLNSLARDSVDTLERQRNNARGSTANPDRFTADVWNTPASEYINSLFTGQQQQGFREALEDRKDYFGDNAGRNTEDGSVDLSVTYSENRNVFDQAAQSLQNAEEGQRQQIINNAAQQAGTSPQLANSIINNLASVGSRGSAPNSQREESTLVSIPAEQIQSMPQPQYNEFLKSLPTDPETGAPDLSGLSDQQLDAMMRRSSGSN